MNSLEHAIMCQGAWGKLHKRLKQISGCVMREIIIRILLSYYHKTQSFPFTRLWMWWRRRRWLGWWRACLKKKEKEFVKWIFINYWVSALCIEEHWCRWDYEQKALIMLCSAFQTWKGTWAWCHHNMTQRLYSARWLHPKATKIGRTTFFADHLASHSLISHHAFFFLQS